MENLNPNSFVSSFVNSAGLTGIEILITLSLNKILIKDLFCQFAAHMEELGSSKFLLRFEEAFDA